MHSINPLSVALDINRSSFHCNALSLFQKIASPDSVEEVDLSAICC